MLSKELRKKKAEDVKSRILGGKGKKGSGDKKVLTGKPSSIWNACMQFGTLIKGIN